MNKFLNPKRYINFAVSKLLALLSPLISKWEKKYIKEYSSLPLKYQPVFIVGAPRTGSTILYQAVTNQFDVLYIDNLVCKFYKNLFFGFWLSNKIFKQKPHNCFKSSHGDTSSCGLHGPSECGDFWYRWLNTDTHFVDYEDITDDMVEQIRDDISAVINYYGKPLVFKNLNAGQRLRLLQRCFPEARFIFVKRDPLFVAQSIIKAKRKVSIPDDKFWSVMPHNVKKLKRLDSYEQIVKQIFFIEKQISKDSKLFNLNNFLTINYIELDALFDDVLEKCQIFTGATKRANYKKAEVKLTEKISLSENEIIAFKEHIDRLDWENYSDQ